MGGMIIESEAAAKEWLREGLGVDNTTMARLELLADMLASENEQQNLVARGTLPHVWQRHIADSAQLLAVSRETLPEGPWLDLGAGAGFPGLVIAALRPDQPVLLVESRRLRTEWLRRAAAALELANAEIVHTRLEDMPTQPVSVISARAFAPLEKLLLISARFSTPDTIWLLPKGASAQHELEMLPKMIRHVFHVEQSLTDPAAGIVVGQLLGLGPESGKVPKGRRR